MPRAQLFLLHFAGGNCYSFQFLQPYFSHLEFIPLELPGRGRRMKEPLIKDFEQAALDIYHQILKQVSSTDFVVYGHSMGAMLALKVTKMLEESGRQPLCLVVTGNPGPGIKDHARRYLLGKEELKIALRKLGGIPVEFFDNEDLFNFFEPIMRADFEINEKDEFDAMPAVNAPIYAIMGEEEEKVEMIGNWNKFTTSVCTTEVLGGGHFFIHAHAERIADVIKACYNKTINLPA